MFSIARRHLDRAVLGIYLAALIIFMAVPVSESEYLKLVHIGAGMWAHFGVFCGLAALLCWNLAGVRYPWLAATATSLVVAVATEAVQAAISYRSASWGDLVADIAGIVVGVAAMSKIMTLPEPAKAAGLTAIVLGLGLVGLFVGADALGLGGHGDFGPTQLSGTVLGALVAAGGLGIFALARRPDSARAGKVGPSQRT